MDYTHDIFISYRRDDQTRAWINKHFVPTLGHHVFMELGTMPTFFIDEQIEAGATWPAALGSALGASRVILLLWSKTYLQSVWCATEISHMLEREAKTGYRTVEKPTGLVFPVIIHDGNTMPVNLTSIQHVEIQDCFNINMSPESQKAEILSDRLMLLGPPIAAAISNAPLFQPNWGIESRNLFFEAFFNGTPAPQLTAPKFVTP